MDKNINSFKEFVRNNNFLIGYIKRGEKSWQDLYEIYDLYGEDESAWDKYFNSSNEGIVELTSLLKNINMDNIQKHINNAQKAVNLIQELTSKSTTDVVSKTPRPITKFFGD
jgi:hypothetical protein